LVPSMTELINKKKGEKKAILQMLLVGAIADDTVSITLFTTFLTIYLQVVNNLSSSNSLLYQILLIHIAIFISKVVALALFKLTNIVLNKANNIYIKIFIILCVSL